MRDFSEAALFAAELGHMAAETQMRHFRKLPGYERKGAIDLLTIADKETEAAIIRAILERFPDHRVLGEEGGAIGSGASDYLWVIDPIDGTTNYTHGLPYFASSIALTRGGEVLCGGVNVPALGEHFVAERGRGAWRNETERLSVSKVEVLRDSLLVTGFPYDFGNNTDWIIGTHRRLLLASQGVLRLGAAAVDMAYVAAGNSDAFYEAGLHPWDVAAASLLVAEAGGKVTDFAGQPYSIYCPRILATNGHLHDDLLRELAVIPYPDQS